MNYPDAEALREAYAGNTWLIKHLVSERNHAESLIQPPYDGNCLNWILGHILSSRHEAILLLGGEPLWDEATFARYRTGSQPITDGEQARPFDKLLGDVDLTLERITSALEASTQEDLDEVVETRRGTKPVAQHVDGLNWHETFHIGQLDILNAVIAAQSAKSQS